MSTLHQVALTYVKNVGPSIAKLMVSYFGSAERVFTVPQSKLLDIPGITKNRVEQLQLNEALRKAEEELKLDRKSVV